MFDNLQGGTRRQLMLLATLYFSILFLESEVGHVPVLAAGWLSMALLPVVWLAVSLLTLFAVQLWPSAVTSRVVQAAMIVAAAIGVIGVFPHLAANNISWHDLGAILSGKAFHGDPGPQWPLAIVIGSIMGYIGAQGLEGDAEFLQQRTGWLTSVAFAMLVIAIPFCDSLTTLGYGAIITSVAAFLLFLITAYAIVLALAGRRTA